jgi:hypothetical protein
VNQLVKPKLLILDLLSGEARIVDTPPFSIGGTANCQWRITPGSLSSASAVHITDSSTPSGCLVSASKNNSIPLLMDGEPILTPLALPADRGSILRIENTLLGFCSTISPEEYLQTVDLGSWTVYNGATNQLIGSSGFHEIPDLVFSSGCPYDECAVTLPALGAPGTWLRDLTGILPANSSGIDEARSSTPATSVAPEEEAEEEIPHDDGEYKCPVCWLHFDGKYIKNIAASEELLGDSIKGSDEYKRFIPQNWDASGNALDPYGRPSPDTACPHCHSRLPAGFIESEQHIFSLVGAPSAGKSYYLAILIKKLRQQLSRKFEITLMDQDPTYNSGLNETIDTLFSARTALEGRITKTDRRGANYKSVYRFGQWVDLPAPFMYSVSRTKVENTDSCLVFYDNAGEHFLPTFSQAEDFQIEHVAKASAIFFLYDPLANIEIKQALLSEDASDQVKRDAAADQQSTILAQMNVKISRALGKPIGEKLKAPMAVMIGKCDLWHPLVKDWDKIRDPVKDGTLNLDAIESNSLIIKEFLNQYAAEIVSSVERISSKVAYFPVSSFGHKPKTHKFIIKDADGNDKEQEEVAPDPLKIKPYMIETPTEWAISQVIPELIPHTSS